jgi:hypothetical protein
VIFGALSREPMPAEAAGATLSDALRALSVELYGANLFEGVPDITTMGELVTFTADIASLHDARPAFV